jgi:hypothetical protein
MMLEMLPALANGSEFEIVGFAVGKPQSPSFLDSLARAGGSVNALLYFVKRVHFPRFGGFLIGKCLEVTLTVLIAIIDNPHFFVRAESTLADACHC